MGGMVGDSLREVEDGLQPPTTSVSMETKRRRKGEENLMKKDT